MTWLSALLEEYHGGPVQRYLAEMEPFERAALRQARLRLLSDLDGYILEIGCGLGQSFVHYPSNVRVLALEPFTPFRAQAVNAAAAAPAHITVASGDAQALPASDQAFDGFVASLVFCSLSQPARALAEVKRVLKRGASVRLLEHVRSTRKGRAWMQRQLDPAWQVFDGSGCHLDRDTLGAIEAAGYRIEQVLSVPLPYGWDILFPVVGVIAWA